MIASLGHGLEFALARDPLPVRSLTPGEKSLYATLGHPARRAEWLRGRAALKTLLRRRGHSEDTSALAFPHPRLSVTHGGGVALAVSAADASLRGLGIDFEPHRPVRPGTERFFLTEDERARLAPQGGSPDPKDLLRLWTVKEALFKADTENQAGEGRHLWSYRITGSLHVHRGVAAGPGSDAPAFRFFTLETAEGFLSVAVRIPSGAHP